MNKLYRLACGCAICGGHIHGDGKYCDYHAIKRAKAMYPSAEAIYTPEGGEAFVREMTRADDFMYFSASFYPEHTSEEQIAETRKAFCLDDPDEYIKWYGRGVDLSACQF